MIIFALIVLSAGFDKPLHVTGTEALSCSYYKNFAVKVAENAGARTVSVVRYGKPAVVPLCNDDEWHEQKVLDIKGTIAGAFDDFLVIDGDRHFAIYDTKSATRVLKDSRVGSITIDKAKLRYRRVVRLPCDDISEQACRTRVEALTGVSVDVKALCNHDGR